MEICCSGLYKNEKKTLLPYLIATPLLFFFGGILVYYFIMPLAIKFFLSFETAADPQMIAMQLEAKVNEYLSLVMRELIFFAFGIDFSTTSSLKFASKNRSGKL